MLDNGKWFQLYIYLFFSKQEKENATSHRNYFDLTWAYFKFYLMTDLTKNAFMSSWLKTLANISYMDIQREMRTPTDQLIKTSKETCYSNKYN